MSEMISPELLLASTKINIVPIADAKLRRVGSTPDTFTVSAHTMSTHRTFTAGVLLNGVMISHRGAISSVLCELLFAQCPVLPKLQRGEQHHGSAKKEMPVAECT